MRFIFFITSSISLSSPFKAFPLLLLRREDTLISSQESCFNIKDSSL